MNELNNNISNRKRAAEGVIEDASRPKKHIRTDGRFDPISEYLSRFRQLPEIKIKTALEIAELFEDYAFQEEKVRFQEINDLFNTNKAYLQSQHETVTAPLFLALFKALWINLNTFPDCWDLAEQIDEFSKQFFGESSKDYFQEKERLKQSFEMNVLHLADQFVGLAEVSKLNMREVKKILNCNRRTILEQTENPKTAPAMQLALQAVSSRLNQEEFNNSEENALAAEISGIAMGLIDPQKAPWHEFPEDLWGEVFKHSAPKGPFPKWDMPLKSGLENCMLVSKKWSTLSIKAKHEWVKRESVSLRALFKDSNLALDYIISNKLPKANLQYLHPTEEKLKELLIRHPQFNLKYKDITETKGVMPFGKKLVFKDEPTIPTKDEIIKQCINSKPICLKLDSFDVLDGNQLDEIFTHVPDLKKLKFDGYEIENHELEEALKKVPHLTSLEIDWMNGFGGEEIGRALAEMSSLTKLNFGQGRLVMEVDEMIIGCSKLIELQVNPSYDLDDEDDEDAPKNFKRDFFDNINRLSDLKRLRFFNSELNTPPSLFKKFKPQFNLEELSLTRCIVGGKTLKKILTSFPDLKLLDISSSNFGGDELISALKHVPKLRMLSIEGCIGEGLHEALPSILELIPDLSRLNLAGGEKGGILKNALCLAPNLKFLHLFWNKNVLKVVLKSLEDLHCLVGLKVSNYENWSIKLSEVQSLLKCKPRLLFTPPEEFVETFELPEEFKGTIEPLSKY